ncbi:MAG: alpha-amylase family glycosyl hydrolase [Chitinophagaceae bacterium]|nr:alpha-amylase family glycosyl hydrolase [Chitinophagaceae bacterium]
MLHRLKSFFYIFFLLLQSLSCAAEGMYPTHWFTGMKNPFLQIMIHRNRVGEEKIRMLPYAGVRLLKIHKAENPNYVFIDLHISAAARPGKIMFRIENLQSPVAMPYEMLTFELKPRHRENGKTRQLGIHSGDFIYLMIPDRFSNGDTSNDIIPGYRDLICDRKDRFSRHGGDFQGILNHLDYLTNLGITALWLTPVIENDMPRMEEWGNRVAGYHGYWFTDHYQIDKRLGGNEGYKKLCDELHRRGLKIIQDAVYNHVGNHHFFALDPPMKDWFNTSQNSKGPNHREEVFYDPYASPSDKTNMLEGWFVPHLPDLNQKNPFVSQFLIQHAIWTTEEFGIDGWRIDTYKYCEEEFLNRCNEALLREFPSLSLFGEAWVNSTVANAYFTRNNMLTPFRHNATGIIDFQACFALHAAMNESFGWNNGVSRLYTTLTQDVLYRQPMNNVIFLDNHDMDRIFSVIHEDFNKWKMGITWLLTLRGIPQLYYGTEVLMKNRKEGSDATVREDFPGGWPDDPAHLNRFLPEGRTPLQQQAYEYISKLARFRKNAKAITSGKTMHYIPQQGVYVYFRYTDTETVMVIANTGHQTYQPDPAKFEERVKNRDLLTDVVSGKTYRWNEFSVQPGESYVLLLSK